MAENIDNIDEISWYDPIPILHQNTVTTSTDAKYVSEDILNNGQLYF